MRELIQEYQDIKFEITKLEEKINFIYSAASSAKIKIITDMPMTPGFDGGGLENIFIRIEKLKERIADYETDLDRVAAHIETKLDLAGVTDTARVVFWYREIHCKTWREISKLTGKSVRQLQRISRKTIYTSLLL